MVASETASVDMFSIHHSQVLRASLPTALRSIQMSYRIFFPRKKRY